MDVFAATAPWTPKKRIVQTKEALDELTNVLASVDVFAFDVETTSLEWVQQNIVGIGIATDKEGSWYIPIGHSIDHPQLPLPIVIEALVSFFTDPHKVVVAYNIKFDLKALIKFGLSYNCELADSFIMGWLLDTQASHKLEDVAATEYGIKLSTFEEVTKGRAAADVSIYEMATYCRMDAKTALNLYNTFKPRIEQEQLSRALRLELELLPCTIDMEVTGAFVDESRLKELDTTVAKRVAKLEAKIIEEAGIEFKVSSSKQLAEVLFKKFKFEPPKNTKGGQPSTDAESLKKLLWAYPDATIIKDIIEFRKYYKIQTTYTESIRERTVGGRVYANFKQLGADTGRFSSSQPNLQNIPRPGEEDDLKVKNIFYAPEGYYLLVADYNQVELRVLAHFSEDPNLTKSFLSGEDVHKRTAAEMFHVPISQVTKAQRYQAKTLNFGLVYGMSEYGLANRLEDNTDVAYAEELMYKYFQAYPYIKPWSRKQVAIARDKGYARTLLGRKRIIIGLDSSENSVRKAAERRVVNTVVQGSAADVIKGAMIKIHNHLGLLQLGAKILIQVHDELVILVPEANAEECIEKVTLCMEHPFKKDLKVPIPIDITKVKIWGEAK